jgi:hypothetical protein
MIVNTPVKWNAPVSGNVSALQGRWKELCKGLRLIQISHCVLMLLALPGLALLCLGRVQVASELLEDLGPRVRDLAFLVTWLLAGVGITLGSCLLLLGQRRCLVRAPQRHSAKELLFVCLICIPPMPACLALSWFLGDTDTFVPQKHSQLQAAEMLQLATALLVLVNVLLFSEFLHAADRCVTPSRSRRAIPFYGFVCFLGGGTLVLFSGPPLEVFLGIAAGWFLVLVWHVVLIELSSRSILRALAEKPVQHQVQERREVKPFSWMHPRVTL